MKVVSIAGVLALGFTASGCATIVKGDMQTIAIVTPPTIQANCMLSSSQGNWPVITPGTVTVERSKEDITVRCYKPGWQDGFATIPSNLEGWTFGNLLIGGLIGVGVDAATGAINHYPSTFTVPLTLIPVTPVAVTPVGGPTS